jgi:acetyltransferase
MHLSAASRYRRFHNGLRALPADLLRQLTHIDHHGHVAIVAQPATADDDDPALIADARYVRLDARRAEFAVVVDDRWQRQGLGRRMMAKLGRHAVRHGIEQLQGDVLADNAPMIALLRGLGCVLAPRDDEPGILLARVALHRADCQQPDVDALAEGHHFNSLWLRWIGSRASRKTQG